MPGHERLVATGDAVLDPAHLALLFAAEPDTHVDQEQDRRRHGQDHAVAVVPVEPQTQGGEVHRRGHVVTDEVQERPRRRRHGAPPSQLSVHAVEAEADLVDDGGGDQVAGGEQHRGDHPEQVRGQRQAQRGHPSPVLDGVDGPDGEGVDGQHGPPGVHGVDVGALVRHRTSLGVGSVPGRTRAA